MFFKKIILAAFGFALTTTAVQAGFSSEHDPDHYSDTEQYTLDEVPSNQEEFLNGDFTEDHVSNTIAYSDFDGYHQGINYWWMDWVSPSEGHGNNRYYKKFKSKNKFKRKLHKRMMKRWKKRDHGEMDPPTQVPVPAAFLLFASALGLLGIRKKLTR